jgi:hypothetical protein
VSAGRRRLPLAHPEEEHTYQRLLGPLGKAKPTVSAASLFADPVADIAVLGSPDRQELLDEAEAYEALTGSVTPFAVADAPKQSIRFVDVPNTKLVTKERTPGQGAALVLSLAGEWLECTVTWRDEWLEIDQEKEIVKCGMSGSPIISPAGQAIGLMSTGSRNPVLVEALPPRIGLGRARGARAPLTQQLGERCRGHRLRSRLPGEISRRMPRLLSVLAGRHRGRAAAPTV